jgi:hypothetical protein
MHRISVIDAWILLGLYCADQRGRGDYNAIISLLPDIDQPLPTHAEFLAAYNKFIYIRFIVANDDYTEISAAAKQLVETVKNSLSADASNRQWIDGIYKILSSYKLKSMCARQVWTEDQYIAATTFKKD